MNNITTDRTFDYDVTEGGVLVYYGAEDGLDLTSASENPLAQLANIARVTTLLQDPYQHAEEILVGLVEHEPGLLEDLTKHAPAILEDLAKLAAEIGQPCVVCNGDGGQEAGIGAIRWTVCNACEGSRVQQAA